MKPQPWARNRLSAPPAKGNGGNVSVTYDEHVDASRAAQRQADRWLIIGSILMGTLVLGPLGLPIFCRGVVLIRRAERSGLSVRPLMVTLIGYVIIIDAASTASAGGDSMSSPTTH